MLVATVVAAGVLTILLAGDDVPQPFTDPGAEAVRGRPSPQPNIVVVMTDDQALSTMTAMPRVRAILGRNGTKFDRSYVSYSLCCPSRATFFTGQLAHNHNVLGTKVPPSRPGYRAMRERMSAETLPIWLQEAGYETAHIGKWLHGYGDYDPEDSAPPGWSEWYVPLGFDSYYDFTDFTLSENGTRVAYEGDDDYQSDVFTNKATEFMAEHASRDKPFFLSLAYVAPHAGDGGSDRCDGSARPAARHEGLFQDSGLPTPPNLNEPDVSDKPEKVRELPLLTEEHLETVRIRYQCQLESLQAIDEGLEQIRDVLVDAGVLKNTIIVYTADNGFMQGEHRFTGSKLYPYEEALRVPLIVSGPGIPEGETIEDPVLNVDLPATILDWANAEDKAGIALDGRSFQPLLDGKEVPARDLFFEAYFQNEQTDQRVEQLFSSIQRDGLVYTQWWTGERELYDLTADPHQLESLHDDPAYAERLGELTRALDDLRACAGTRANPVDGKAPCG